MTVEAEDENRVALFTFAVNNPLANPTVIPQHAAAVNVVPRVGPGLASTRLFICHKIISYQAIKGHGGCASNLAKFSSRSLPNLSCDFRTC
jgi:hypothetical protein